MVLSFYFLAAVRSIRKARDGELRRLSDRHYEGLGWLRESLRC